LIRCFKYVHKSLFIILVFRDFIDRFLIFWENKRWQYCFCKLSKVMMVFYHIVNFFLEKIIYCCNEEFYLTSQINIIGPLLLLELIVNRFFGIIIVKIIFKEWFLSLRLGVHFNSNDKYLFGTLILVFYRWIIIPFSF